jgi:hypothetical protein
MEADVLKKTAESTGFDSDSRKRKPHAWCFLKGGLVCNVLSGASTVAFLSASAFILRPFKVQQVHLGL